MRELAFEIAAWVLTIAGLAVIVWALFWDRPRGRRRCPKCWYDMSAAGEVGDAGVRCPECGRVTERERSFHKRRRRWRCVLGSLVVLIVAYAAIATPRVREHGWVGAVPTTALIVVHPFLFDRVERAELTAADNQAAVAAAMLGDLRDRVRDEELHDWQWSLMLRLLLRYNADTVYDPFLRETNRSAICRMVMYHALQTNIITEAHRNMLDSGRDVRVHVPPTTTSDFGVAVQIEPRFWEWRKMPRYGSFEVYDHVDEVWEPLMPNYTSRQFHPDRVFWSRKSWIASRTISDDGEVRIRARLATSPTIGRDIDAVNRDWTFHVERIAKPPLEAGPVKCEEVEKAIVDYYEMFDGVWLEPSFWSKPFTFSVRSLGNDVFYSTSLAVRHAAITDHAAWPDWGIPVDERIAREVFDGAIGLRFTLLANGTPFAEGTTAYESLADLISGTGGVQFGWGFFSTGPGTSTNVALHPLPTAAEAWAIVRDARAKMQEVNFELEISACEDVAREQLGADRFLVFSKRFPVAADDHGMISNELWKIANGTSSRGQALPGYPTPVIDWSPAGPPAPAETPDP